MIDNITSEIRSTVPEADIKRKIVESIDYWKVHALYFNLKNHTTQLTTGIQSYAILDEVDLLEEAPNFTSDILKVILITLTYGQRPLELKPIDANHILSDNIVNTNGLPSCWSIWANRFYFFPTPNLAYPVNIHCIKDINTQVYADFTANFTDDPEPDIITDTSADAETNPWVQSAHGERLIRNYAKSLIYGELLRNDTEMNRSLELASRAYRDLKAKTSYRSSGFEIEPDRSIL